MCAVYTCMWKSKGTLGIALLALTFFFFFFETNSLTGLGLTESGRPAGDTGAGVDGTHSSKPQTILT